MKTRLKRDRVTKELQTALDNGLPLPTTERAANLERALRDLREIVEANLGEYYGNEFNGGDGLSWDTYSGRFYGTAVVKCVYGYSDMGFNVESTVPYSINPGKPIAPQVLEILGKCDATKEKLYGFVRAQLKGG